MNWYRLHKMSYFNRPGEEEMKKRFNEVQSLIPILQRKRMEIEENPDADKTELPKILHVLREAIDEKNSLMVKIPGTNEHSDYQEREQEYHSPVNNEPAGEIVWSPEGTAA